MTGAVKTFWPTAHDFAEAVQCPALCFSEASLVGMVPAVDRLGMPLVTSGQFAYVFKLNPETPGGESLAVRCFRGFLGDREERYRAIDAHLAEHAVAALPRFRYLPHGILVSGRRFPALVMEWVEGPTLDVYVGEVLDKPDVLRHMADEWVRLVASLRAAGVAHGDLQHGNIIVERGRLRLVDLDGMFVPALEGMRSSEVGHQHYQHPRRVAEFFSADVDNFSALVIYLSLVALAERPTLWAEHHDENLLFTRADFENPAASALFAKVREIDEYHALLAGLLETAALSADPSNAPPLPEIVGVKSSLPAWITAPPEVEVAGRTREVSRAAVFGAASLNPRSARLKTHTSTPTSSTVQTLFNAGQGPAAVVAAKQAAPPDPLNLRANTGWFARRAAGNSYSWVWWIPVHNVLLTHFWAGFGVTGFGAMLATFMLLLVAFILYGFLRALYLAETVVPNSQTPGTAPLPAAAFAQRAVTGASHQHGAGSFAPAFASAVKPVVGNRGLMIFHTPDCAWASKIPTRQREDLNSPAEARAAGFRPCRVCKP